MAVAAPHVDARQSCKTRRCIERVAMHACSQTRPVPCIRRAALHWHVDLRTQLRRARCESGLNPYAYNGAPFNRAPVQTTRSSGLLQFLPSTWATTPYRGRSIWSAKWSALAGAWMQRAGRGSEWACR
jgi:hypothetical protein